MKHVHGMPVVDFELSMMARYKNKVADAKNRNLAFELSFSQFRNIMAKTKCAYTGRRMTLQTGNASQKPSDITIERIDNAKGYVPGNCVAICKAANGFKSLFESPDFPLTIQDGIQMFKNIEQMQNKA